MSCVAYNPGSRTREEGRVSLLSEVARSTKGGCGTKVKRRRGQGKKTLGEVEEEEGIFIGFGERMTSPIGQQRVQLV